MAKVLSLFLMTSEMLTLFLPAIWEDKNRDPNHQHCGAQFYLKIPIKKI